MAKFYIVWNSSKTEGFITDCVDDAETAASGFYPGVSCSTAALAFYEAYCDDDDEDEGAVELVIEEIDIPGTTRGN